jgi:CBS-domain-containing membrane protein
VAVTVKDVMSAPVTTVAPDDSLCVAGGLMSMVHLSHLPVVDGRGLVGMLTQRDILGAPGLFDPVFDPAVDTRETLKAHRVGEVMSGLVTIGAEASLQQAVEKLLKHGVDCLSVLEGDALVGIVTTSDLLRALAGPPRRVRRGGCTVVSATASSAA